MAIINTNDVQSNLERLVEALESGAETEIMIERNGRVVAKLVPMLATTGERIGVAKGAFIAPDPDKALDAEVGESFCYLRM